MSITSSLGDGTVVELAVDTLDILEIKFALLFASIVNLLSRANVRFLFMALFSWLNLAQVIVELVNGTENVFVSDTFEFI